MESDPIRHRIEHTKNRHSRAVYRDGTVIIRLARNLNAREEQEHIDSLLRRMKKMVLKERERVAIDPFQPLLSGGHALTLRLPDGSPIAFMLIPGERTEAKAKGNGWIVTLGPGVRRKSLHRFLWKLLSVSALPQIDAIVRRVNDETFRVPIRSVRVRYASSQWGSCSHRGDIMVNAVLLFAPAALLQYLIVHELAHCVHRNHSKAYWRLVERAIPECQARRATLRKYRITSL